MRWRNNTARLVYRRNAANSGWEIIENYGATADPGAGDDSADGYVRGSVWINTIRKLVEVWAPPNENDTEAYARCVAKASGFGIDEPLDLHDYACLRPILTAMIRVENGRQPYTDAQIDAALVRAGVMPPQRSLQETRTVKGGQVAAAGTIGAGAIGAIQETVGQAHEALVGVVPYLDAAKWGLLAVTLIGIGVMLWARIDDRRKGLR